MVSATVVRVPLKVFPSLKKGTLKSLVFNVESFLDSTGLGKSIALFNRKDTVFRQGDPAKEVFYIQKGGVKLIVVNESGREAVVAMLCYLALISPATIAALAIRRKMPDASFSGLIVWYATFIVIGLSIVIAGVACRMVHKEIAAAAPKSGRSD
jgi:uncharacterized membrane protein YhaH (DUF805 family)